MFEMLFLSVDQHLAAIGPINAGENLDQRRFAGAVFAAKRVDFAPGAGKRHTAQGFYRRERLGNAAHLDGGSITHAAISLPAASQVLRMKAALSAKRVS
ncbi:hypothetical protein D9M68_962520 [compost metagenome]